MKKWIVITTINSPTKAIDNISKLTESGWRCVVVGDRKTPANWASPGIDYLSYDQQLTTYGALAKSIPANHYCRKNLGYLYAMQHGAEVILETDDDNIPGPDFGSEISMEVTGQILGGTRWANVYKHFADRLIWPRGNPLNTIHDAGQLESAYTTVSAPVQQYLADGDPDVDAIYRLLFKDPLTFIKRAPVILDAGTWCSFNSQNTIFYKEAFPLLYLPCHVSFRMTDIWRSFVAQAALWKQDKKISFHSATVIQERNEHNLMKDFRDEVDGYLNNDDIASILEKIEASSLDEFVLSAWKSLIQAGIATDDEYELAYQWMQETRKLL
jgi:hypothetical protein